MGAYKHILVGLDLTEEESQVLLSKAEQLATQVHADISLAHIIEPLTFAYAGDLPIDLTNTQEVVRKHATHKLDELANSMTLKPKSCEIIIGRTATELRQLAADISADLILVGSHGRHGLALLLGSTASEVIHGATCDVLAVRI